MPHGEGPDQQRSQKLLADWQTLATDLGLRPGNEHVARRLVAAYSGPGRHYHTDVHLAAVLTVLHDLWTGPGAVPAVARAAVWFHDAVYDPRAAGNEAASAQLAATELIAVGATPEDVREIGRLVLSTEAHEPVDVAGSRELLDADLAVLGAPVADYDRYAADIRREYAHLDAETFRLGRLAVLRSLLQRSDLFVTTRGRQLFDAQARANLRREIGELQGAHLHD